MGDVRTERGDLVPEQWVEPFQTYGAPEAGFRAAHLLKLAISELASWRARAEQAESTIAAWKKDAEDKAVLIASLEQEVRRLGDAHGEMERELRQERGLKALLANGMPPTGNPDFDEVLATHPIAAMIQRGWLPGIAGFDDLPALESAICFFYGVQTIAEAVNPPLPPFPANRRALAGQGSPGAVHETKDGVLSRSTDLEREDGK